MDLPKMSMVYLITQGLMSLAEDSSQTGQIRALRRALTGLLALVSRHPDEEIAACSHFLLTSFAPLTKSVSPDAEFAVTDELRGKIELIYGRHFGLVVPEVDMLLAGMSLDFANQERIQS